MGSLITQELAIRRPDLLRACVVMGTLAKATGWVRDYMAAEIEWRREGHRLSGMMSAIHYAAFSYPASALADAETVRNIMAYLHSDDWSAANEQSLVSQWEACNDYDVSQTLLGCEVPLHVIGFEQDVQAPPACGREVARLAPNAKFCLIDDAGHYSCWGHKHVEINRAIESALIAHL